MKIKFLQDFNYLPLWIQKLDKEYHSDILLRTSGHDQNALIYTYLYEVEYNYVSFHVFISLRSVGRQKMEMIYGEEDEADFIKMLANDCRINCEDELRFLKNKNNIGDIDFSSQARLQAFFNIVREDKIVDFEIFKDLEELGYNQYFDYLDEFVHTFSEKNDQNVRNLINSALSNISIRDYTTYNECQTINAINTQKSELNDLLRSK